MKKVRNGFIKNLRYFCLLVVIVFGLIAIVGSNGGGDGDGGGGSSLTVTGESGNQVNLNGSWSAGCIAYAGESEKFVNTISGLSFSVTEDLWETLTDCSGTPDFTMSMSGTATLGGEVTATMNSSSVTATKIDVVVSTAQYTINNSDTVLSANEGEGYCGVTGWAVGVPKDVLGTYCMPDTSFKDIIYIDDTDDPDLWYSGIEDGTGYPTEIDVDSAEARM